MTILFAEPVTIATARVMPRDLLNTLVEMQNAVLWQAWVDEMTHKLFSTQFKECREQGICLDGTADRTVTRWQGQSMTITPFHCSKYDTECQSSVCKEERQ